MAFKKNRSTASVTEKPSELFRTLTRRKLPDVMTHQRDVLDRYYSGSQEESDVAIQLPTGSGKTLVALLIAEWRRRKFNERVVYLCPTRQLAYQIHEEALEKYGIETEVFVGKAKNYAPAMKSAYNLGAKVAITTYSSLFNINPFFTNPDVIIIDDAHAAENYIVKMWSMQISGNDEKTRDIFNQLAAKIRPKMSPLVAARFTGDVGGSADMGWVDKVPTRVLHALQPDLAAILDIYDGDDANIKYVWPLLRDGLQACHLFVGWKELYLRPNIPPTWRHSPFANARQRIFMSATLGEGGDLERLTGRQKIQRIAAPPDFENPGVGRRFFVFPELALEEDATLALRREMQVMAGRSVVLTTSRANLEKSEAEAAKLPGFSTFHAVDIEQTKKPFVTSAKAVALLAGRFDGIDFPEDECRLLCLDGLPRATNLQEKFLMDKMGAAALLEDRIHTRVIQAVGRCTRALQDRSAIYVTGEDLLHYLSDNRNWKYFHPDFQAELDFGVEQSLGADQNELKENFSSFLANDNDWEDANREIIDEARVRMREPFPGLSDLQKSVGHEIKYSKAMWELDFVGALAAAKDVLANLTHPELRGYRAWWHYLAGSAAHYGARTGLIDPSIADAQYREAQKAAENAAWLLNLSSDMQSINDGIVTYDPSLLIQVESIEENLLRFGPMKNNRLRKECQRVREHLADKSLFETGVVLLGQLLGFAAGNSDEDSAPDPWWFAGSKGLVFEANVNASESGDFGSVKVRQAAGHPDWLKKFVPEVVDVDFTPIILTARQTANDKSRAFIDGIKYWKKEDFSTWVERALAVVLELGATVPPQSDLSWRAKASLLLDQQEFTITKILESLPMASDAFIFVDGPDTDD